MLSYSPNIAGSMLEDPSKTHIISIFVARMQTGDDVGWDTVGECVGETEGFDVGELDGDLVGLSDGFLVGARLGDFDGATEGEVEGPTEGA